MADIDFNFKTNTGYNLGQTTWNTGLIKEPGANSGQSAADVQKAIERLSHLVFYVGSGGVSDVYVVGNGTPPAGGYTPLTNPVIIKGTGLRLNGAPLNFTGGATVTGAATITAALTLSGSTAGIAYRRTTLPPLDTLITTAFDVYRQTGTLMSGISHTVKSTPTPRDGARIKVVKPATAHDVVLIREDSSEIATLPSADFAQAEMTFDSDIGEWILSGGINLDLSTATPIP